MKTKERYVFLECTVCRNRNYTTHKKLKAAYKIEKAKYCQFCKERDQKSASATYWDQVSGSWSRPSRVSLNATCPAID